MSNDEANTNESEAETLTDKIVSWVIYLPHKAIVFGLWTVFWGGTFITFWLSVRWFMYMWANTVKFHPEPEFGEFESLIHHLLHGIELLLLIPLPVIVGLVVYKNLGSFTLFSVPRLGKNEKKKEQPEKKKSPYSRYEISEREMGMAKRLMLGILSTVAATRMLDDFLHGRTDLRIYISGAIIIIAVAIYIAVALREKPDRAEDH
jgi:hypothetical protein